ncbi:MAG: L,D-transpeptidase [Planctomycetes bacterium]|nr:L,D-transpeptidase [Planctomycetota bacterium]
MAQEQPAQVMRKRQPIRRVAVVAMAMGLVPLWTGGANVPNPDVAIQPAELAVRRPRVVILKAQRLLHLLDADHVVRSYPIDLGAQPIGTKRQSGDGRTPEGRFRICVKRSDSPHHRFLGIDYPDEPAVVAGLAAGLLSAGEAGGVRRALRAGRCPDWGTALGGGIGIHGRARGEDWTAGCIAVSDASVEELFALLRVGDSVEILP